MLRGATWFMGARIALIRSPPALCSPPPCMQPAYSGGAGRAPSALTMCATDALVEWSSWWRLTSSQNALTAATTSTNSSASVLPQPPNGDTTSTHARHACARGAPGSAAGYD